jgi:hypothetical protein
MSQQYILHAAWILAASAAVVKAQAPLPDELREIQERAREQAEIARQDVESRRQEIEQSLSVELNSRLPKLAGDMAAKAHRDAMALAMPQIHIPSERGRDSGDRAYERGQRALDSRRWDEALEYFSQAATQSTSRADGALYWKAYVLGKLGRRDDALAAIAELRKAHPSSRWLEDAKALELEVKQASGQRVSPESETDEDLKLMALNGLVQSDPERALPLLEKLLKSSQSPKLKERTLFVLAQSDSPRARQLLEQVARGGAGNPDLQLKAINYLAGRRTENRQLLREIYASTTELPVKRALVRAYMASGDTEGLLQVARSEKAQPIRLEAISMLGASGAYGELVQIYQSESSPEVKERILQSMGGGRNPTQLLEVARAEKDPKLRRTAIRAAGSSMQTGDALVSMYGSESDPQVKRAIMDSLAHQRNAKLMVDLARKESDPQLKREIVSRLSGMKSKEAADYLLELLK